MPKKDHKAEALAWEAVLRKTAFLETHPAFPNESYAMLQEASLNAAVFDRVTGMCYREYKQSSPVRSVVPDWLHHVDESSYDLANWLEAIDVFVTWTEEKGLLCPWSRMLGYIDCCQMAAAQDAVGVLRPLADVVAEMLEQHGFDPDFQV